MDYSEILIKICCSFYDLIQVDSKGSFQEIIEDHAENMTVQDMINLIGFYRKISPIRIQTTEFLSSWTKIAFVIILSVFSALSLIVNAVSCYVAICYRKKSSLCYVFAFSLAISDLLQTIVTYVPEVNNMMNNMAWKLGYWTCNALPFVQVTSTIASSLTLCSIAVGRYIAVVHAMRCKSIQFSNISIYVVVVIWIISICFGIPSLIIYRIHRSALKQLSVPRMLYSQFSPVNRVQLYCITEDNNFGYLGTRIYLYIVPSVAFLPLFFIISILYSYMGYYLWMRKPVGDIETSERNCSNLKKKKGVVKMLITLIALYFICRFPICCFNLKIGTVKTNVTKSILVVKGFLTFLKIFNCFINPILYSNLHEKFKRASLTMSIRIFGKLTFKKKQLSYAESNQISTNFTRSTVVVPKSINLQQFDG